MEAKKHTRLSEIDSLRGLAILGMIIFHLFFILDYSGRLELDMYKGAWLILARFVQFTFLGLVGVSMALSYQSKKPKFRIRQFQRGTFILAMALLISLVTIYAIPSQYIRFGILHLIGTSILLFTFLARYRIINLILGISIVVVGFYINDIVINDIFYAILGFDTTTFYTLDHFPIFPWMGLIPLGIFIGHSLYQNKQRKIKIPKLGKIPLVSHMGRHSLLIYMTHVPIIIMLLVIFQVIPLQNLT